MTRSIDDAARSTDAERSDQLPNRQFQVADLQTSIMDLEEGVNSLDEMLVVVDGRAFRQNGDSSLSLEIVAVHGSSNES